MKYYPILLRSFSIFAKPFELGNFKNPAENPIESKFCKSLQQSSFGNFLQNKKVILDSIEYYPDITYYDSNYNICIDIEIDEPYSKSGDLTHFMESEKDLFRDKEFIKNGWNVLRFSERQVQNYHDECINIVIFFIGQIKSNLSNELPNNLKHIIHRGWTKEESQYYKNHFIRDYYNYEVRNIEQNQIRILAKYQSNTILYELIIKNCISDFDIENDMVFIPYFISECYIGLNNQPTLIFVKCVASMRKRTIRDKTVKISGFTNSPKVTINDSKPISLLEKIESIKRKNERFLIENDLYGYQYYYNFAFHGTMREYLDNELIFVENLDKCY